jgi:preprotein translocase subunit SecB
MSKPTGTGAFTIAQIILEKAEFSHSADPFTVEAVPLEAQAEVELGLNVAHNADRTASVVRLRLSTRDDGSTGETVKYRFDVTVSTLVALQAPLPVEHDKFFAGSVAAILFPFVREVIASLTSRGRFGVNWIQPLNVRAALEGAVEVSDGRVAQPSAVKARKATAIRNVKRRQRTDGAG